MLQDVELHLVIHHALPLRGDVRRDDSRTDVEPCARALDPLARGLLVAASLHILVTLLVNEDLVDLELLGLRLRAVERLLLVFRLRLNESALPEIGDEDFAPAMNDVFADNVEVVIVRDATLTLLSPPAAEGILEEDNIL